MSGYKRSEHGAIGWDGDERVHVRWASEDGWIEDSALIDAMGIAELRAAQAAELEKAVLESVRRDEARSGRQPRVIVLPRPARREIVMRRAS